MFRQEGGWVGPPPPEGSRNHLHPPFSVPSILLDGSRAPPPRGCRDPRRVPASGGQATMATELRTREYWDTRCRLPTVYFIPTKDKFKMARKMLFFSHPSVLCFLSRVIFGIKTSSCLRTGFKRGTTVIPRTEALHSPTLQGAREGRLGPQRRVAPDPGPDRPGPAPGLPAPKLEPQNKWMFSPRVPPPPCPNSELFPAPVFLLYCMVRSHVRFAKDRCFFGALPNVAVLPVPPPPTTVPRIPNSLSFFSPPTHAFPRAFLGP